LNSIKNPFEQSLFILVFIPYFQLFLDINKRVSRISANIPLIKNGYEPFSFLQIKERDYINAILAIYELNDVSLMADLFVNNYLLNLDRYR
jgi:Fic family protein